MSALPPLPDHRADVLRALDKLGAHYQAFGCTIGTIGAAADLDAGEAWLAVTQCAHAGLVVHDDHGMLREDRARRTWSLSQEGRLFVAATTSDPEAAPMATAAPSPDDFATLRDRITDDHAFQAACQRYAHGNGSSAAIAAAALNVLSPAK